MKLLDKYRTWTSVQKKSISIQLALFCILVLFFICQIFVPVYAQTAKQLKTEQSKINKEAKYIESLLSSTKKNHKASIQDLRLVKQQILNKQSLISSIANEIGLINGNIEQLKCTITNLEDKFNNMKRTYAETIRKTYRSQNGYNKLMFLFSSDDFNDAYKRYKYIQYYTDYRKGQFKNLSATKDTLRSNIGQLENKKVVQKDLLSKKKSEKKALEVSQEKQEELVVKLKKKEKELTKKLGHKKEAIEQLDQDIKSAIAKAAKAAAKAAAEKKAKALAKALAAKKAKAKKAKKARQLAASSSKKAKAPAKEQTVSNKTMGANILASITPMKNKNTLNTSISGNRQLKLNKKFVKNKGKLPWPVSQGVITSSFGTHPHPVIKTISITNNGIDIATGKGALVKAIHDGVVASKIYTPAFKWAVIIKHDDYFTVYTNLKSTSVKEGDKINTLQPIGVVSSNQDDGKTIVHLEVWKGEHKMNPIGWIKRKR